MWCSVTADQRSRTSRAATRHHDNPIEDLGTDYETEKADFGQLLVDGLVRLLDLERIEKDVFRGRSPNVAMQRVFGGQVAGQALVAAGRTVPHDRIVHSLHSYFIRPGDPSAPIVYNVDRVRDGRSFTTRRVVAVQHGDAIFALSASFQLQQDGLSHQSPSPESPHPLSLPTAQERDRGNEDKLPPFHRIPWPFEVRYADKPSWEQRSEGPREFGEYRIWMKATGRLPDDPLVHACALTFAADLTLLDSVLVRQGLAVSEDPIQMASLDHAVWFHRPFRADEWLLYSQESPSASGSRGLCLARIFDADGMHVASVMQEGMIRLTGDGSDPG
jgi:acyl-CoA thioesterase II